VGRYRLYPTDEQTAGLVEHCAHARFCWNLALEQWECWWPGRPHAPGYVAQSRQLTEARSVFDWLAAGSQTVQQQALRDFDQAKQNFFDGTHRRPTWRKTGVHEGFRIVGPQALRVEKLSRRWAQVSVPKIGWVRFRLTRPVPEAKSYRVTLDRAGRWHIAFAAIPEPLPGPDDGSVVGIDRGVAVTLALSDGTTHQAPVDRSVKRLQRRLARAKRGSKRRGKIKARLAGLQARNGDARKDWAEKSSTTIARSYDLIRIEDLKVKNMTRSASGTVAKPGRRVAQKAGLNRAILGSGWSMFATRLGQKAKGRVEKVSPAFTSQRCSGCGHFAAESRKSQTVFCCVACSFTDNADVNAAKNIAAGHAVTARGGLGVVDLPVKREPQLRLDS
jgi:transposase